SRVKQNVITRDASSRLMQRSKSSPHSLDHFVSLSHYGRRDSKPELPGSLEVDHELELCRLFNGQLCWLCPFQDFVRIRHALPRKIDLVRSVGREPPEVHEFPGCPHCWQSTIRCNAHDASVFAKQHWAGHYNESLGVLSGHRGECADKVVRTNGRHELKL